MKSYCAVAIMALLVGAYAQGSDDPPCSKQMELEQRCMMNVVTSPEAQMVKDRMKQSMKTCAPDYPQECHAQMEAAHECMTTIAKTVDTDPTFKESKAKSGPAVDECFVEYPSDIKKGVMEIFKMGGDHGGKDHGGHKKWDHHKKHNATSSSASGEKGGQSGETGASASSSGESNSNETFERKHGGGGGGKHGGGGGHRCRPGRHGGHHGMKHSESNSNETSTSSEEKGNSSSSASSEEKHGKGGKSGSGHGKSGGMHGGQSGEMDSKCRKTEAQKQCIKGEMTKLSKDSAFVDVVNTLVHQKQKCKQTVTWSCCPKEWKQKKCVFKATKPCREAFMSKMTACLQSKGFTLPPFMLKEHTAAFTTPMPDINADQQ